MDEYNSDDLGFLKNISAQTDSVLQIPEKAARGIEKGKTESDFR